jgi:hypothetical protein
MTRRLAGPVQLAGSPIPCRDKRRKPIHGFSPSAQCSRRNETAALPTRARTAVASFRSQMATPTRPHVVVLAGRHATPRYGSRARPNPSESALANVANAIISGEYVCRGYTGPTALGGHSGTPAQGSRSMPVDRSDAEVGLWPVEVACRQLSPVAVPPGDGPPTETMGSRWRSAAGGSRR